VGAISLGWRPDGTRIRRKVTGRTKTDVREKLKRLQAEADAGLKTSASYTLAKAVDDWAAEALEGLAAKTVRSHVDLLRPVTMLIGQIPLRDVTAHDVRRTLNKLAETRSTRTMASTHNVLVRAIRHAEANDHVGRNVATFVKPPQGKTGRPSRAMSAAEAAAALERAMRTSSPEQLSVYGALHLAAATAAAACYDRTAAEAALAKARGIADCTAETNHMGTAFGPVNVAIHAIAMSLKLGDPRTATETGEALDLAALPVGLVGRRTQADLDLARAYAMSRKDAAAVNLLLAAERLSPQLVRYDRATWDVLTELLRREHRPSTPELRPLAHRAGVI
jgi:hypothetical protein